MTVKVIWSQQEWIFICCFHVQPGVIGQLCYCRVWIFLKKVRCGHNTENPWAKHCTHNEWCSSINSDTVIPIYNLKSIQTLPLNTKMFWCVTSGAVLLSESVTETHPTSGKNNIPGGKMGWDLWEAFRGGTKGARCPAGFCCPWNAPQSGHQFLKLCG